MVKAAVGMIAISAISLPAFAQLKPIKFEKDSLPNGLQVIYSVDKTAPVVATVVHYRVGSKDEETTKTGYAHFFEHLMFEATDGYKRASIDKFVEEAGGTLNAHTSDDETVFYLKLPAHQIKLALWIESERMRMLHVDKEGVETQRGVVTEELKMRRENSPYGLLFDKLCEHLNKGTPYYWTTIGSKDHIAAATIQDFKNFYDKYYQPNNATLVICGDINIAETKKWVKEYFGRFPRAAEPTRNTFNYEPMNGEEREEVTDEKAQLPLIVLGYRGPSILDPDYYAVNLLTDIMSAGESSRFYQRLVSNDQIAMEASVGGMLMEKGGIIMAYALPTPGKKVKELETTMDDEIQKLLKNGIKDEELQKVKNIKEAQFVSGKKGCLEKAETLAGYNSYQGNPALINTEIDKYLKVTKEDILRVAKKYFGTSNRAVITFWPKNYKE